MRNYLLSYIITIEMKESLVINRGAVRKELERIRPTKHSDQNKRLYTEVCKLLQQRNASLIAHYYVDEALQKMAEETGGFVGDSLEMARFGSQKESAILVVAGVRFMGETAKILSPKKTVLMPTLEATCSLDIGCPIEEFAPFCDAHPDRTVVVYANTSALVKARADWVVTSSIAVDVVEHLSDQGKKVLWAPDKHLGRYVAEKTGADMLLWDGACIVHEEFKARGLRQLQHIYPEAVTLVHPESPVSVRELSDVIGSTSQLIKAAQEMPNEQFIVATDKGIFYKMQQLAPHKTFIEAPTAGKGATCRSCAHCPWMALNALENLKNSLEHNLNEIELETNLINKAILPLQRMLRFKESIH